MKYGGVALEVVSTIDFTDGKQGWSPAGFHLRRDGRWLGTFEYFKDGKAYLAPDLAPEEHAAVLAAVVSISSTGRWFQLNPDAPPANAQASDQNETPTPAEMRCSPSGMNSTERSSPSGRPTTSPAPS